MTDTFENERKIRKETDNVLLVPGQVASTKFADEEKHVKKCSSLLFKFCEDNKCMTKEIGIW